MDPAEYLRRPQREREQIRASLRETATRARRTYAELLAAEAGIAARCRYPNLARLTFTLSADAEGVSAMLVGAYTATGRRLWHVDHDEEWPDESLVADRLAAAYQWWADLFDPAPVDHDPPGDRYQLTVPRDPAAHGRSVTAMPIRTVLDISTAHLPPDLADRLDRLGGVIAYRLDYGWLMPVPARPEPQHDGRDMPPEIRNIYAYARERDCDFVLFDRDADPLEDDLPTWPWE